MEWYYELNDSQNGPVDDATLKRLVENGTLSSENLVWRAGMDDWVPIGNVLPNLFSAVRSPSVTKGTSRTSGSGKLVDTGPAFHRVDPTLQGGDFPSSSELRRRAREGLSGSWGTAILCVFLFGVIQFVLNLIPLLGFIVSWLIIGPLTLGLAIFFLTAIRQEGEGPTVGMLFDGFKQFGTAFGIFALTNLIIFFAVTAVAVPSVFLATPFLENSDPENPLSVLLLFLAVTPAMFVGIWLYCRFALVYYIAYDNPELGVLGSIKMSGELMSGLKIKLVILVLSFIGWHFLGMLLFGLGLLVSVPYMMTAIAAFYESACATANDA